MPQLIYYVAASLDRYIATADGGVDWLAAFESTDSDHGYAEFYRSIDALIMGRHTFEQVQQFGDWPYPGKPCWVVTHQSIEATPADVIITSQSPPDLVRDLAAQAFQRVWLVGGGQLAAAFRSHHLISEYWVAIVPIILGTGIPLFGATEPQETLTFIESQTFPSGIILLKYRLQEAD